MSEPISDEPGPWGTHNLWRRQSILEDAVVIFDVETYKLGGLEMAEEQLDPYEITDAPTEICGLKETFGNREKIERFDRIREECLQAFKNRHDEDADTKHWVFESAMTNTLATDDIKDFWKAYNND